MSRYLYARNGAPILSWKNAPPQGSRAGDAKALGSLGEPTLELPVPGGPEPLGGCGCKPKPSALAGCGCHGGEVALTFSGVIETVSALSLPMKIAAGVGSYLLYKHIKRKR